MPQPIDPSDLPRGAAQQAALDPAADAPTETTPALQRCCDMHGPNCEPPSELCCDRCSEARHPFHPEGMACTWAGEGDVQFAQAVQRLAGNDPGPLLAEERR